MSTTSGGKGPTWKRAFRWLKDRIDIAQKAGKKSFRILVAATVFAIAFLFVFPLVFTPSPQALTPIPYSEFKLHLNQVDSISTSGRNIDGVMKGAVSVSGIKDPVHSFTTEVPSYGDGDLESELEHDGVKINEQKIPFDWDIVVSATPLATLAAILAGFVIVSIVAILTFAPDSGVEGQRYAPLIPFLGAFFTLVLATFLFSVLAGSGASGGARLLPLTEGYFISLVFGCGVVQTCVGIEWLMEDYKVAAGVKPVRQTARWIVHLGVLLAAVATAGVLVQPLFILSADQGLKGSVAWILMAGLPVLAIPLGTLFRETKDPDRLKDATFEAVLLALGATIGYGVTSTFTEQVIRSSYGPFFFGMVFAQLLLCALITAYEAALPLFETAEAQPAVRQAEEATGKVGDVSQRPSGNA